MVRGVNRVERRVDELSYKSAQRKRQKTKLKKGTNIKGRKKRWRSKKDKKIRRRKKERIDLFLRMAGWLENIK